MITKCLGPEKCEHALVNTVEFCGLPSKQKRHLQRKVFDRINKFKRRLKLILESHIELQHLSIILFTKHTLEDLNEHRNCFPEDVRSHMVGVIVTNRKKALRQWKKNKRTHQIMKNAR